MKQSIGGGPCGFCGCQSQITNTPSCTIIEYPNQKSFSCTPAGFMLLGP